MVYHLHFLSALYLRLWAGASADVPEVRNVDYGLFQRCERRWVSSPPTGRRRGISLWLILIATSSEWLTEYKCTAFPARSACDANGQSFCIAWHTAGYASQFSLVFAAAGLVTVTLANITTKKRRRRAWRIVSALVGAHGESNTLISRCASPNTIHGRDRSASDCCNGDCRELASSLSSIFCAWDYFRSARRFGFRLQPLMFDFRHFLRLKHHILGN